MHRDGDRLVIEPVRKRGLVALLKTMKPLNEAFPKSTMPDGAEIETGGKPIGRNDLLIAAHAQATGATIVTANADEFKRVRGLKVEDRIV